RLALANTFSASDAFCAKSRIARLCYTKYWSGARQKRAKFSADAPHKKQRQSMLTSDLIKPFVRKSGGQVRVDLLDEADSYYLQSAQALIELFQQMVGRPREAWWQAREVFEGVRTDYLRLRGLAKVLEDEATFTPLSSNYTPTEVRNKLFAYGPVFPNPDIFHP